MNPISFGVRGRPGRGPSDKPTRPQRAYRARHEITVGRDTPARSALSAFETPSAANSTIPYPRRQAGSHGRGLNHANSRSRSPPRNPSAGASKCRHTSSFPHYQTTSE